MSSGGSEGQTARRAVAALAAAFASRDPARVAELVHPEAVLRPLALGGEAIVGRDGARRFMQGIGRQVIEARVAAVEQIGDHAILIGRTFYERPEGGVVDAVAVWAITLRDGLLWRGEGFRTQDEARAYLDGILSGGEPSTAS